MTHAPCQTAASSSSLQSSSVFACDACITSAVVVIRDGAPPRAGTRRNSRSGAGNKHAAGRRDREREIIRTASEGRLQTHRQGRQAGLAMRSAASQPGQERGRGGEQELGPAARLALEPQTPSSRPSLRRRFEPRRRGRRRGGSPRRWSRTESPSRRLGATGVSAAAARVGGDGARGRAFCSASRGFTRDFGYHHEYQGAAGPRAGPRAERGGYGAPPKTASLTLRGSSDGTRRRDAPACHGRQGACSSHGTHQSNHQQRVRRVRHANGTEPRASSGGRVASMPRTRTPRGFEGGEPRPQPPVLVTDAAGLPPQMASMDMQRLVEGLAPRAARRARPDGRVSATALPRPPRGLSAELSNCDVAES